MLELYGTKVSSRLLLGTARYPSPAILADAVRASKTDILTVSLRRETSGGQAGRRLLPDDPRSRHAHPAQYRRLPHGVRSGADRQDGARGVRHELDQAGGDRPS